MAENEGNGVIYKITNIVNSKVYIGQTRERFGKNGTGDKCGIEGRFKGHIYSALYGKGGCVRLANAIKKHGKDMFKIEKLLNCSMEELDDKETGLIKLYDATNKEKGYNISLGGKGRSVDNVPESARRNISSRLKINDEDEMNIIPVNRKNILVGYKVRRREQGKSYNKWFTATDHSIEENLLLAQIWLIDFKSGNIRLNTKETQLPENISYMKCKNGLTVGYRVNVLKDGIRSDRSFQNSINTMKEKLNLAIQYKDQILNGDVVEKRPNINIKHVDLPRGVNIYNNRSGELVGYVGKIIINKKMHKKLFIKMSVPMDEKLKQATEFVNSILDSKSESLKNDNPQPNVSTI
jgi:hypothetical protein